MTRKLYWKMAKTNMLHHSKMYLPYLTTCVVTLMMFYMMHALSVQKGIAKIGGSNSLRLILSLGTVVIGIFSAIFLIYTNSFLMKRRKKEIGLYNVLGLEKKHIGRILLMEMLISAVLSISVGLGLGMIWNKLMYMILLKLIHFEVPLSYEISIQSAFVSVIFFMGIFLFTFILNYVHIRMLNPIELMKGGVVGEKEPRSKWLMTLIGFLSMAAGYYIALTTKSPLKAMSLFFVAVLLVMVGTYSLFSAGSISFLKSLRKNKKIYYQSKYFISISSMIYRMKQNAVGLANICILSSGVLVVLSTTIALYVGVEDALEERYPTDIKVTADIREDEQAQRLQEIAQEIADEKMIRIETINGYWNDGFFDQGVFYVLFTVEDYNRMTNSMVMLQEDEVLLYNPGNKTSSMEHITIGQKEFQVNRVLDEFIVFEEQTIGIVDTRVLVVKDKDFVNRFQLEEGESYYYYLELELDADENVIRDFHHALNQESKENGLSAFVESKAVSRDGFVSVYGGMFFLGFFVGGLFLMITVLIIYYKQISEGFDDKERYEIMQKVGIDHCDIKKAIRSQILLMFFLPLGTSVIHIAAAFPMITRLLVLFNLSNTGLFMFSTAMTILAFAFVYTLVYSFTARVYYRIVG